MGDFGESSDGFEADQHVNNKDHVHEVSDDNKNAIEEWNIHPFSSHYNFFSIPKNKYLLNSSHKHLNGNDNQHNLLFYFIFLLLA